jgi:predicted outer membrane repeat protein
MRRALFFCALVLAVTAAGASCRTWTVNPDGSGDAPSIKAALYYGASGDTVLLGDGTFTGRDNTEVSYRGKAIVVKSAGGNPHACIIDCMGSETNWSRGFLFYFGEGPGSVLQGVTVTNGYGYEGGGIWCWGSSPTIRDVILSSNTALYSGGGIYCGGGSSPGLSNVTVYGNAAPDGSGLFCISGSSPRINSTIIAYNGDGGSVEIVDGDCFPDFACCDIYGNVGGDWIGPIGVQYGVAGNVALDPLFCLESNPAEPLTVQNTSPCAPGHHLLCGGMGAAGVGCWLGVTAVVDIEPSTLNPASNGRWITCYIELADGLDPSGIDVGSVRLDDSVPAAMRPTGIGDHDGNGTPDLMVKFGRADVLEILEGFGDVEITVSGEADNLAFSGVDTVYVLEHSTKGAPFGAAPDGSGRALVVSAGDLRDGSARIGFDVAEAGFVDLSVYDVRGRLVNKLVEGPMQAGSYYIDWDGLDDAGGRVGCGLYFLRLETGAEVATGKVMIAR